MGEGLCCVYTLNRALEDRILKWVRLLEKEGS